ncbi:hypothetical protein BHE74_00033537, partial [Ensete ventricosum]
MVFEQTRGALRDKTKFKGFYEKFYVPLFDPFNSQPSASIGVDKKGLGEPQPRRSCSIWECRNPLRSRVHLRLGKGNLGREEQRLEAGHAGILCSIGSERGGTRNPRNQVVRGRESSQFPLQLIILPPRVKGRVASQVMGSEPALMLKVVSSLVITVSLDHSFLCNQVKSWGSKDGLMCSEINGIGMGTTVFFVKGGKVISFGVEWYHVHGLFQMAVPRLLLHLVYPSSSSLLLAKCKPSPLPVLNIGCSSRRISTAAAQRAFDPPVDEFWRWHCERGAVAASSAAAVKPGFVPEGLGLVAQRDIPRNEVVVEVPKRLWIDSDTVVASEIG